MKTNPGRFFEDYRIGEVITHAVPRTTAPLVCRYNEGVWANLRDALWPPS